MLEDILLQVNKPGRYIGREWNASKKDFAKAKIKFALCFPDLYEVGMSNLGLRIIYGLLNGISDVSCERVFSCDSDMELVLRKNNLEIFSLESQKRLKEFDLVGFSLGSELDYTNVLNILDLGRIPPKASERSHDYPLVIAGGPCVLNPEPMHDFFDLFVIGEAEELILEFIQVYRKYQESFKAGQMSKEDLLFKFSSIEGVYVPSLYEVTYGPAGAIEEFRPKVAGAPLKIKKRFVKDLNTAYFPTEWILPYIQIIHDRLVLEVMRGCPNTCRFCQARSQYAPFRIRGQDNILELACSSYKRTGYEEVSLAGLSVSDYPDIEGLLRRLTGLFKPYAVNVSLPSMKANALVGNLSSIIASVKKTGLTFAPEAGSERLRKILGKDFDEEGFLKVLGQAYASGYRHIKLYFMIGLPLEGPGDLDGIIELAKRASDLRKKISRSPAQVNISINTLIPKPHTPLQWLKMEDPETIKYKQNYLRGKVGNKRFLLNFHNCYMSFLEGVLSRGDRRLSEVILCAFKKGARFDAWSNHFAFELWLRAFQESGIDPQAYLKERPGGALLPWDFIDVGIAKDALKQDAKMAQEAGG